VFTSARLGTIRLVIALAADLSGLLRAELEVRFSDLRDEVSELKQIVAALRDKSAKLKHLKGRRVIKRPGKKMAPRRRPLASGATANVRFILSPSHSCHSAIPPTLAIRNTSDLTRIYRSG
jgi:hypothetical protein